MEISIVAEKIGHIGPLPITNSILLSWVVSVLLIILAVLATDKIKAIPEGIQNFFETIIEFLFNTANSVIEDEEKTRKYFPLVATIFIFVIANNWIGLVPGVGTIGLHTIKNGHATLIPLFRSGNADLNTTLALAVITMIAVQVFGVAAIGIVKYGKKFINFSSPINFFVGILELIGEFARIISFSFRLFGNVFAGEVLLVVVAFLVPLVAPLPFFFLELFVGFIQALVFTMLALVFIKGATAEIH
ncbi:MAG: F0F1 ATP synthase subunit A [Candidatus Berkelbacteria bacterium]|nr:F0F1 ATP synthase subunit A [Candidatus Berkelbacteria bacterium]